MRQVYSCLFLYRLYIVITCTYQYHMHVTVKLLAKLAWYRLSSWGIEDDHDLSAFST